MRSYYAMGLMNKDDLIKKLEELKIPEIEIKSHRQRLKTALFNSSCFKEKNMDIFAFWTKRLVPLGLSLTLILVVAFTLTQPRPPITTAPETETFVGTKEPGEGKTIIKSPGSSAPKELGTNNVGVVNGPETIPMPQGKITVRQSGGADMLPVECGDKDYITETADYIIEGTVEKVESKWNEERTLIFTYTDLSIEKYVKGTPFTETKLQIVTPGGTVGEITLGAEDQPIFHEDKKVRVYLQETNGEFSIICSQFGVEEI